jgi:hypothetical protein
MSDAKGGLIQFIRKLPDGLTVDDVMRELLEFTGWPKYPKLGIKYTRDDIPVIERICGAHTKASLREIAGRLRVDISDVRNGFKAAIVARMLDSGFTQDDIREADRSVRRRGRS